MYTNTGEPARITRCKKYKMQIKQVQSDVYMLQIRKT